MGYWGRGCTQKCQCNGRGNCSPFTGICDCHPGYMGTACDQRKYSYWGGVVHINASVMVEGTVVHLLASVTAIQDTWVQHVTNVSIAIGVVGVHRNVSVMIEVTVVY